MFKKILFFIIISLSIVTFSNFAWSSIVGTWEMSGKVITTVKAKGMKTKKLTGTLDGDSWIFHGNNFFESNNIGGSWSQKKTKFSVDMNDNDIISFFEEILSEELETDISVVSITKKACAGTENIKNKTIKGSFKIYMNISGYDEDCDCERTGKVTVSGSFTGTPDEDSFPPTDITGGWDIYKTTDGTPGEVGPALINLVQTGNSISGTKPGGQPITGSINGLNITMYWTDLAAITCSGTVSADGQTMSGIWSANDGRTGTWRAIKIS